MTRRSNNKGSISFREDRNKPYIAQISFAGKRFSKSFETEKLAQTWLDITLAYLDESDTAFAGLEPVQSYLIKWVDYRKPIDPNSQNAAFETTVLLNRLRGQKPLRWATYQTYRSIITTHIIPRLSPKLRLGDVRRKHIEAIILDCQTSGVGARTIQAARNIMHRSFEDAVINRQIEKNPVTNIHLNYTCPERKDLTPTQAIELIKAAKGTHLENLIPIAISTGARRGELAGLMWKDLDIEELKLKIERQGQRRPEEGVPPKKKSNKLGIGSTNRVLNTLKTLSSSRTIDISKKLLPYFIKQRERNEILEQLAGERWQENDLIFPSSVGTLMEPTTLRRRFKKLTDKVDLPEDFHFHDLRHTMITGMTRPEVNGDIKTIQKRAGQKDDRSTMRYLHPLSDLERKAADAFDDLFLP
jgi:integrase